MGKEIDRLLMGLSESNPSEQLPVVKGGRLSLEDLLRSDSHAFRKKVIGGILFTFIGGLGAGLAYGASTGQYGPFERWAAILGPWAGYCLRMLFEPDKKG